MGLNREYLGLKISLPAGARSRQALEEAVLDALTDALEVPVPQKAVDNALSAIVMELYQQQRYEALQTGQYNMFLAQQIEEQKELLRERAYRQVKLDRILEQIIREEELDVTREELEAEAEAMAGRQNTTVAQIKGFFGEDLFMLRGDLLVRKAIALVCDSAVTT